MEATTKILVLVVGVFAAGQLLSDYGQFPIQAGSPPPVRSSAETTTDDVEKTVQPVKPIMPVTHILTGSDHDDKTRAEKFRPEQEGRPDSPEKRPKKGGARAAH